MCSVPSEQFADRQAQPRRAGGSGAAAGNCGQPLGTGNLGMVLSPLLSCSPPAPAADNVSQPCSDVLRAVHDHGSTRAAHPEALPGYFKPKLTARRCLEGEVLLLINAKSSRLF